MSHLRFFEESDCDYSIKQHAIQWLVCYETYRPERRKTLSLYWQLFYDTAETCMYRLECNQDRIIIGFRGAYHIKDVKTYFKMMRDVDYDRVYQAIVAVRGILEKQPNAKIYLTGHGVGGTIAKYVAHELHLIAITFNSAGMPTRYEKLVEYKDEVNYHIVYDILSAWQPSKYTVRIHKGLNPLPHWIENLSKPLSMISIGTKLSINHDLDTFSKYSGNGKRICGFEEDALLQEWWDKLPFIYKYPIRAFLFLADIDSKDLPRLGEDCNVGSMIDREYP